MQLIAVRHGETAMNIEERLQGSKGPDLSITEMGALQIRTLRETLPREVASIYASPLLRALESAAIITEVSHQAVITDDRLVERDFGTLTGMLKSDIDPVLLQNDLDGDYDYRPYGGESVGDVRARIREFLSALPLASSATVIAVTHRGVIRVLYDIFPDAKRPDEVLPGTAHTFSFTSLPNEG